MQTLLFRFLCALMLFASGSALVSAHTSAISTTPKSGAILSESPGSIEITFKEAARLTSVVVHQDGQAERKLSFTPDGSATKFVVANPMLQAGKSEVRWIALSTDGHVVKGVIVLTLKPSAQKTS